MKSNLLEDLAHLFIIESVAVARSRASGAVEKANHLERESNRLRLRAERAFRSETHANLERTTTR